MPDILVEILEKITTLFSDPIVLFTALAAMAAIVAAIVAAIAAVRANAPNSREKTDILKCEILSLVYDPEGLKIWQECILNGEGAPDNIAKLLDIERSRQIIPNILRTGVLGKIFKSRKYSKYEWVIYITAAMVELDKEEYENVRMGIDYIKPEGD